ncbi:MAG: 2-amino-4-hydroxy-6-hydroxymethyldihydropteridine diphosphokinase [Flavobacteriales bacterium]|jgi:2-amino-4-hydroxy-6-hydroxymethyldihydropteridine diphosphokinase
MLRHIYLCIGGNLGEREANLEEAIEFIDFNFGDVLAVSAVYESEPWGMNDVPNFLNQVVHLQSELSNEELLAEIAELEEFFGRERSPNGYVSREMDIDVLLIDQESIETENLRVPHPRMTDRRFVLEPLHEIAPELLHPVLKKTVAELLKACSDKGKVTRL